MALPGKAPRLWVIAGPNGAGKSSIVSVRLAKFLPIVNPDDIARELRGSENPSGEAGRLALAERRRLLNEGDSFGIETTLSGVGVLRFMATGRSAGYRLMLLYVGVAAPELARFRVIERVARGGHDVPASDVLRRYHASMDNIATALDLAERAWVLDNSGRGRRLLISCGQNSTGFVSSDLPAWATIFIPDRFRTRR